MPPFIPINVNPDEGDDDEVEDTRELQIEKVVKLYQTAVKLHARGPAYFTETKDTYETLLNSNIFRSDHSILDQRPDATTAQGGKDVGEDGISTARHITVAASSAQRQSGPPPDILSQILHLACKNRGQLEMDQVRFRLQQDSERGEQTGTYEAWIGDAIEMSLQFFACALQRDETDAELWRRTASVSMALGKRRIARLCLEAAQAEALDGAVQHSGLHQAGLEEVFACEQLRQLLIDLNDDSSLNGPLMSRLNMKRLTPAFKSKINQFPFLPPPEQIWSDVSISGSPDSSRCFHVDCRSATWVELGTALASVLTKERQGLVRIPPGTGVRIYLPAPDIPAGHGEATQACLTKRTPSQAGLSEVADGGRVRSKRLRAKGALTEATSQERASMDQAKRCDLLLRGNAAADEDLFATVDSLLNDLGAGGLRDVGSLQAIILDDHALSRPNSLPHTEPAHGDIASANLYWLLRSWSNAEQQFLIEQSAAFNETNPKWGPPLTDKSTRRAQFRRLSAIGYHSRIQPNSGPPDEDVGRFVINNNHQWRQLVEVAIAYLYALVSPRDHEDRITSGVGAAPLHRSSYLLDRWPSALKNVVAYILDLVDFNLYNELRRAANEAKRYSVDKRHSRNQHQSGPSMLTIMETVQAVVELLISAASWKVSGADHHVTLLRRARLDRWARLMDGLIHDHFKNRAMDGSSNELPARYLWSTVIVCSVAGADAARYRRQRMTQLKSILRNIGCPAIRLPNCFSIPEVSVDAAQREISSVASFDLLLSFLNFPPPSPVSIIEWLDPILEYQVIPLDDGGQTILSQAQCQNTERAALDVEDSQTFPGFEPEDRMSRVGSAANFLAGSPPILRILFWGVLAEAYEEIDYPTKVLSCTLRSIDVIVAELRMTYLSQYPEAPHLGSLALLCLVNRHLSKAIIISLNTPSAFECIDYDHLKTSMTSIANLLRVLHMASLMEDQVRVGRARSARTGDLILSDSIALAMDLFHEMQIRAWLLLYVLVKEAMFQYDGGFPSSAERLSRYLFALHRTTGRRGFCGSSNRVFLRYMLTETVRLKPEGGGGLELRQLVFDLYGFKIGWGGPRLEDHGCQQEPLDGRAALSILEPLLQILKGATAKDLAKRECANGLRKIQRLLETDQFSRNEAHNDRVLDAFMKGSVHPRELYRSTKGLVYLPSVQVPLRKSLVTRNQWFFFLGDATLAGVRSVKRTCPSDEAMEALEDAEQCLRRHLNNDVDSWMAWFRLGQIKDARLEEAVLWSAEKMNSDRPRLAALERAAIHCYTMSLSCLNRAAGLTPAEVDISSSLYTEFGFRIYASSRPPFSMRAFQLDKFQRVFSGSQKYRGDPHTQLSEFSAWRFASVLFEKAIDSKPDYWINHFMKGKCLWRMFNHPADAELSEENVVSLKEVIQAFVRAIEMVPPRRSEKQDPIIEPHYKLVSVVHKLVRAGHLEANEACDILQATPYARQTQRAHDVDSWEPFVLRVLTILRTADKANWHHRMTARASHIIYDGSEGDLLAAAAARDEFTKHIFTKAMNVQVWKPEFERAGRHFVYQSRYTEFFVTLLLQLNDRTSLAVIVKRIGKKRWGFYEHRQLWKESSDAYMRVLRNEGHIQEGYEAAVLRNRGVNEFKLQFAKMMTWIQLPSTSHPTVDILREAIELNKADTYSSYESDSPFSDLIADTYVTLHEAVVPTLADTVSEDTERTQANREMMRVDTVMNSPLYLHPFHSVGLDPWDRRKKRGADIAANGPSSLASNQAPAELETIRHPPNPVTRLMILRCAESLISRASAATKHDREPEPSPPTESLQDSSNRKSVEGDAHDIIAAAGDSRFESMRSGNENRENEGKNDYCEEAPDEAHISTEKATVTDDRQEAMEIDHHHIQQGSNIKDDLSHANHDTAVDKNQFNPASPGRPSTSSSSSLSTVSSSVLSLTRSAVPSYGPGVTSPHPIPTPTNITGEERQVDNDHGDHHMDHPT